MSVGSQVGEEGVSPTHSLLYPLCTLFLSVSLLPLSTPLYSPLLPSIFPSSSSLHTYLFPSFHSLTPPPFFAAFCVELFDLSLPFSPSFLLFQFSLFLFLFLSLVILSFFFLLHISVLGVGPLSNSTALLTWSNYKQTRSLTYPTPPQ